MTVTLVDYFYYFIVQKEKENGLQTASLKGTLLLLVFL